MGQFYNGRILAGILWLIITPGLWIGTGGLLGWTAHVVSAYTAYSYARDHRVREAKDKKRALVRTRPGPPADRAKERHYLEGRTPWSGTGIS